MTDFKQLKKLADACRKAGIKHYKQGDLEFTLSDDAPVKRNRQTKGPNKPYHQDDNRVETSELTPEQLLFYSVQDNLSLGEDEKAQ